MTTAAVSSFTLAYWCVLVAALLPIVCAGLAKRGGFTKKRSAGGYDNHNPRKWMAAQGPESARANAAQANTFEALPFFIGAVVIAHQLGAPQSRVDLLAITFIALRVIYIGLYISDKATARSVVWGLALLANIGILFAGFR